MAQFGNLAKANNTMIVPSNLTDISTMVSTALTVMKGTEQGHAAGVGTRSPSKRAGTREGA